ncbi:hypothetical protein PVAP13_5NG063781 [Panicum virgatum]|uniref:Uncharacterized protein n=1 Tax=Panicum virgatum TaxID=38727 RepID=A0A8T0RN55_PANVG|nr:hypothetical protein PVAP13_5NG063781 [Panicum virgatum]
MFRKRMRNQCFRHHYFPTQSRRPRHSANGTPDGDTDGPATATRYRNTDTPPTRERQGRAHHPQRPTTAGEGAPTTSARPRPARERRRESCAGSQRCGRNGASAARSRDQRGSPGRRRPRAPTRKAAPGQGGQPPAAASPEERVGWPLTRPRVATRRRRGGQESFVQKKLHFSSPLTSFGEKT